MNLCFVTPADLEEKRLLAVVEGALEGGADAIQLRRPGATARDLFPLALLLRQLADRAGAKLIVNDRADVAVAAGAAAVHLGARSLPVAAARHVIPTGMTIGVSCHNLQEAVQAQLEGADYIFLGTVFPSPSKPGGEPLGVKEFARIRAKITVPIVAIGGVSAENVGAALAAGADGVAVISAIADHPSPVEGARALAEAIRSWRGGRTSALDVSA